MTSMPTKTGYASVNGLKMYYSQLAILPGTTHVTVVSRDDLLIPIITPFLDAPMPEAK